MLQSTTERQKNKLEMKLGSIENNQGEISILWLKVSELTEQVLVYHIIEPSNPELKTNKSKNKQTKDRRDDKSDKVWWSRNKKYLR